MRTIQGKSSVVYISDDGRCTAILRAVNGRYALTYREAGREIRQQILPLDRRAHTEAVIWVQRCGDEDPDHHAP